MRCFLALAVLLFSCNFPEPWTPQDVAQTFSTVPAQVCVAVNENRNAMLRVAGDALHERAVLENWSSDRELEALAQLFQRDDMLRAIVSPGYTISGQRRVGICRTSTELLESLTASVVAWSDLDNHEWQTALADVIATLRDVAELLRLFGVADVYAWLNDQNPYAKLGDSLRIFLDVADRLLRSGSEAIRNEVRP